MIPNALTTVCQRSVSSALHILTCVTLQEPCETGTVFIPALHEVGGNEEMVAARGYRDMFCGGFVFSVSSNSEN